MTTLDSLLVILSTEAKPFYRDISDTAFDNTSRVSDWRNYVPLTIKNIWTQLDETQRILVMLTAENAASQEEWE